MAKNEERRLADLRRRQEYARSSSQSSQSSQFSSSKRSVGQYNPKPKSSQPRSTSQPDQQPVSEPKTERSMERKCFYCKKPGHLLHQCPLHKKKEGGSQPQPSAKQVVTEHKNDVSSSSEVTQVPDPPSTSEAENASPLSLLFSESEDEGDVKRVMMTDHGSRPQFARVDVQGVPADGVIDTAADITIMGGKLFALVASSARRTSSLLIEYRDRKVFHLDGRMEVEISFQGKAMKTTVYIKMDAPDQLLLSEGACRQLGIVTYHPSLHQLGRIQNPVDSPVCESESSNKQTTLVPCVRVSLVKSLKLPPNQSAVVPVRVEGDFDPAGQTTFVKSHRELEKDTGLIVKDALLPHPENGLTHIVVTNLSGFTGNVSAGTPVGVAEPVQVSSSEDETDTTATDQVNVRNLSSSTEEWRKRSLLEQLKFEEVPPAAMNQLTKFLTQHHAVFSLEEGEHGETDIITMSIDTGDSPAVRQHPRHLPFVLRGEVAKQLRDMQQNGVIQPSSSPWSSPVVMVRKKDGSHRFCVDYRQLNAVTKTDAFPLPRIDDLLDQLGGAKHFSTLDLASGFWQILMEPESREKTAFTTPHGLYEFLVMPFGLTNAPAVFQRLMHCVISGLNPPDGKDFVTVYLDDILVFSSSLSDHLDHLQKVLNRLKSVNLKLKPSKCQFMREEVEYLGHVVTRSGLRPNARLTEVILNFQRPDDIGAVRRFLGLASYYRRFIPGFAKIANPLHGLTTNNALFDWTPKCETAFTTLKSKLVTPPVLAYPSFEKDFTLETDASILGLGAVLAQLQEDSKSHPIAYASRALNKSEKNYCVTELETLAVVWAITHFRVHLYGNIVKVLTDHSAVKSILETPNPMGKHARWWTKVFGSGVKTVSIVYRAGRENAVADALSRSRHDPPPTVGIAEGEAQVASVDTAVADIGSLLHAEPATGDSSNFSAKQRKDPDLKVIIEFLEEDKLPEDSVSARKLAAQEPQFVNSVLHFIDHRQRKSGCPFSSPRTTTPRDTWRYTRWTFLQP